MIRHRPVEGAVLILSNEDVDRVLTMPMVIAALEDAYRDLGEGDATTVPRVDSLAPHPTRPGAVHAFKTMSASFPRREVVALRLNSDVIEWPTGSDGAPRRRKIPAGPGGTYNGMIQLYSMATGEPLAMFPDGAVQRMRVGGTNGLAVRHLARDDARVVALIGSGWQAGAQVLAVTQVRPIERIRVFSPSEENRHRFVERLGTQVDTPLEAVAEGDAAVEGADIVMLATNSMAPVFDERWIVPGVTVTTIRGPEVSGRALAAFDRVVVHERDVVRGYAAGGVREMSPEFRGGEYRRSDAEAYDLATAATLVEVIAEPSRGRRSDDESIIFHNFVGMGLQFAAVGAAVFEAARQQGLGREIPTEWFLQHVHP